MYEFVKPFAITLTKDQETAKDLMQETIYRALANSDKYNVGTNIKAWLYTIMRNIFINNYRRKARENTVFDSTPNDFLLDYNQVTVGNYPRKIDEYLAAGKPVVATDTEAMEMFSGFCYLGKTAAEYIDNIEKILKGNIIRFIILKQASMAK